MLNILKKWCLKLSEEEQIEKLKGVGLKSVVQETKMRVIDTLATYGEKAIPAITEIIDNSMMTNTKTHGLEVIKKIKEK